MFGTVGIVILHEIGSKVKRLLNTVDQQAMLTIAVNINLLELILIALESVS